MKRSCGLHPSVVAVLLLASQPAWAQFGGGIGGGLGGGGLGGVYIDPQGVLRAAGRKAARPAGDAPLDEGMVESAALRRVSLRGLDRAVREALDAQKPIPAELRLLGGLVKIDFVVFDRRKEDVFLAGPAESWRVDADGREVGTETGRPLLHLEDLVAALRCVCDGVGSVRCSIDPTREGLAAIQEYFSEHDAGRIDPTLVRKDIAERMGLQVVTTGGVPKGSRFALVMIEADYRMKRLAMGLEKFPGLTSHMDIVVQKNLDGDDMQTMSRWWFSPRYDAVLTNEQRTVFQFEGQGVELLHEHEMIDRSGERRRTGKGGDRYSQSFTEKFPKIERRLAVYADLRNLFDLMLAAGVVQQQRADLWLARTAFMDENIYEIPTIKQPRQAEPAVNARRTAKRSDNRRRMVFSFAFGGVSMQPSAVLNSNPAQVTSSTLKANGPKLLPAPAKLLEASASWKLDLPEELAPKRAPDATTDKDDATEKDGAPTIEDSPLQNQSTEKTDEEP